MSRDGGGLRSGNRGSADGALGGEPELVAFLKKPLPTVAGEAPAPSVAEVDVDTLREASASIAAERSEPTVK